MHFLDHKLSDNYITDLRHSSIENVDFYLIGVQSFTLNLATLPQIILTFSPLLPYNLYFCFLQLLFICSSILPQLFSPISSSVFRKLLFTFSPIPPHFSLSSSLHCLHFFLTYSSPTHFSLLFQISFFF